MRPVQPSAAAHPVHVGARLRASRRMQGFTIEDVAHATNLTKGFISRVERDETSPSVATLITLCQALSLPVGSLFQAAETEVVRAADAPLINMGGTGAEEHMLTPRGQGRIQVLRSLMEPGAGGGEQLYTVNCDVEVVHVISGRLTVRFPNADTTLEAGDTATFAGREPHTWFNPGQTPGEIIWILVPAAWSGSA